MTKLIHCLFRAFAEKNALIGYSSGESWQAETAWFANFCAHFCSRFIKITASWLETRRSAFFVFRINRAISTGVQTIDCAANFIGENKKIETVFVSNVNLRDNIPQKMIRAVFILNCYCQPLKIN